MRFNKIMTPTVESYDDSSIYLGDTVQHACRTTSEPSRPNFLLTTRDESSKQDRIINSMVQAHSIKVQKYHALFKFWLLQTHALSSSRCLK